MPKKGRKRKERENSEEHTTPKCGRPKKTVSIHSHYPAVELEGDEVTYKRNCTAIMKECEKNKPRKDIILKKHTPTDVHIFYMMQFQEWMYCINFLH